MSSPFNAGRAHAHHFIQTQDEPGTSTPEELAQRVSSELDLLYAPTATEGKSAKSIEQIEINREYHFGILQGLKEAR